uniref:Retrotransposon gag protein n=1 Tax=Loa loa TaxID=7209 RepID=A0A1I7VP55_LOALO
MVDDGKGILHLITEGTKAVVVLEMYKKDFETIIEQTKTQPKESTQQDVAKTASLSTINLPQLPLPTFSGDPKTWREFWSSFEAAAHSQTIPDIQKLNCLFSCLRREALKGVIEVSLQRTTRDQKIQSLMEINSRVNRKNSSTTTSYRRKSRTSEY